MQSKLKSLFIHLPESLKVAIHGIAFIIIFYYFNGLLAYLGAPPELSNAISAGFGIFYLQFTETLKRRGQTSKELVEEFKAGNYYIHPLLAIFYTFGLSLFSANVIIFVIGMFFQAVGYVLGYTGTIDVTSWPVLLFLIISTFVADFVSIIPISIYIAHRVRRLALLWIMIGVILKTLVNFSVNSVFIPSLVEGRTIANMTAAIGPFILYLLFLLLGSAIGYWRARVTQAQFVLFSMYKQLSRDIQKVLIEIVTDELARTK
jgi:hypothetical protein